MKRVGITGGIGCGKTTVVAEFKKLGVHAFVADQVAADYYRDPSFLADIRRLFGDAVFLPDGSVDKRLIASRVFANSSLLAALNALVHPRVMADFETFCRDHAAEPYVLFESAILFDYGFDALMDKTVCVYLDLQERIERLRNRDGSSVEQIMARVANQMPAEEMMRRADYVILNFEGNPRQRQVAVIDNLLRL
jgi:dephospho-CoA kinase